MSTAGHRHAASAARERGFVVIAVLWILAALASLVTIFSAYLANSARALSVNDTALQAEALVTAGVELAAYQLSLAGKGAPRTHGSFQFRLGDADISVSFVSEAARVDLNAAPKELLANLLAGLGADQERATEYADRIVAWRTPPKAESANSEEALYRAAGLTYSPRQAPFPHVNELSLVLGLPPALVERALPFVTVFNGSPGVDVLIAPEQVIAALPGMTPLVLKDFLHTRSSLPNDPGAIAAALGPAQASAAPQKSEAVRLLVAVKFADGRRTASEIVIALGGGDAPYRVLSWQDEAAQMRR